jgi:hypothetical protein
MGMSSASAWHEVGEERGERREERVFSSSSPLITSKYCCCCTSLHLSLPVFCLFCLALLCLAAYHHRRRRHNNILSYQSKHLHQHQRVAG